MIAGHCIMPSILPWLGWLREKLSQTRPASNLCQDPPPDHMYDDYEGVAIGAFALSLRTANGGISWDYLFIDDDEFQPHLNYTYGDNHAWRKSAQNEGYAVF